MAAPAVIDLSALIAPISCDRPSGEWLPDVHAAIEQARRSDDGLPRGDWKRETKAADWRGVIKIAGDALAARTKDLKIAVFLLDALVKEHGLPGLRDGLRLLRELHERFWESLHPEIEDGDLEGRAAPIEWLNDKLPLSLKEIAVTRSRDGAVYSLLQWEESRALAQQKPEIREQAAADGKLTGEQFEKAVAFTPRAFYEGRLEDIEEASEEWRALDRVIDEKFGRDAPGMVEIRKCLEQHRDLVDGILTRKRELEPAPVPATRAVSSSRGTAATGTPHPGQLAPGVVRDTVAGAVPVEPVDRDDALRRLAAVASFFRRTEPHSPVSLLVERAVKWGQMPLEQWLREVIRDEGVLGAVRETLGLTQNGAPAEEPAEESN